MNKFGIIAAMQEEMQEIENQEMMLELMALRSEIDENLLTQVRINKYQS